MSVFLYTNRFDETLKPYSKSINFRLVNPSDDIRELTLFAKQALQRLYKEGIPYKKSGIMLAEFTPKSHLQMDLFHQPSDALVAKSEKVMSLMESINKRYGKRTIRLAAEGFQKKVDYETRNEESLLYNLLVRVALRKNKMKAKSKFLN